MGEKSAGSHKVSPEAISKIKELGNTYTKYEKKTRKAQKDLEDYVNKYLDEHGLKEDMQAVSDIADALPAGIVRFKILDLYFELQERRKNKSKELGKNMER